MRLEFNNDTVLTGWRAWLVFIPLSPFIFVAAIGALVVAMPLILLGGFCWLLACLLLWKRP